MTLGVFELLLVLFIVLLIIGPHRIANLGKALGRGIGDFKLEFGRDKREELSKREDEEKPSRRS